MGGCNVDPESGPQSSLFRRVQRPDERGFNDRVKNRLACLGFKPAVPNKHDVSKLRASSLKWPTNDDHRYEIKSRNTSPTSAQEQRAIAKLNPREISKFRTNGREEGNLPCCNPPRKDEQPRIWLSDAQKFDSADGIAPQGISSLKRSKTGQTTNHCLNCISGNSHVMMT